MIATLLAIADPGDEVVVFEPFYENYRPDAMLSGATTRLVRLRPPDWTFDPHELRAAFNNRTKAIIVNSPNNPTGRVFTREELETVATLAREHDALVITDEIYEHILYDGARHIPVRTLEGMQERTVLINSMSKTWSVTGWRIGWVIARPELTDVIRKVHDFLTVGAAAPLQQAGVVALNSPPEYYTDLANHYRERRDLLLKVLTDVGFQPWSPEGAYYILCDIGHFPFATDVEFVRALIQRAGVAAVPGSSFFDTAQDGRNLIRFCFCKKEETLREAGDRLRQFVREL